MTQFQYAVWLAEQTWSAVMYFWPISYAVIIGFAVSLYAVPPAHKKRHFAVLLWVLALFLLPFVAVLIGAACQGDPELRTANRLGEALLNALSLLALASSIAIIALAGKDLRLRAVGMVCLPLWLMLCALFISGMAVTGDWL